MKKLFLIIGYSGTIQVIGILTSLILARHLGPTGRGLWAKTSFLPLLIANLAAFGSDTYFSRGGIKQEFLKNEIFKFIIVYSFIVGFSCVLFLEIINYSFDSFKTIKNSAAIMIVSIPFALLNLLLLSAELGFGRVKFYNINRVLFSIVYICFFGAMIYFNIFTIDNVALTYCITSIVTASMALYFFGDIKSLLTTNCDFRSILKKIVPFGFSNIMLYISSQIPVALITVLLIPDELGNFTVAMAASSIHVVFGSAIGKILLSSNAKRDNLSVVRVSIATYLIVALVLVLIIPKLILIIFGVAYSFAGKLSLLIIPYTIVLAINDFIDDFFKSSNVWKLGLMSRLVSSSIILLFGYIILYANNIFLFLSFLLVVEMVRMMWLVFKLAMKYNVPIRDLILIKNTDFLLLKTSI